MRESLIYTKISDYKIIFLFNNYYSKCLQFIAHEDKTSFKFYFLKDFSQQTNSLFYINLLDTSLNINKLINQSINLFILYKYINSNYTKDLKD